MEKKIKPLKEVSISKHLKQNKLSVGDLLLMKKPLHEFTDAEYLDIMGIPRKAKPPMDMERLTLVAVPRKVSEFEDDDRTTYTLTDAEWNDLNKNYEAQSKVLAKKKRPQKYNTTYCFNLSKAQLESLSTYAKFNNTSKSNCIRKAITEMLNKGRT